MDPSALNHNFYRVAGSRPPSAGTPAPTNSAGTASAEDEARPFAPRPDKQATPAGVFSAVFSSTSEQVPALPGQQTEKRHAVHLRIASGKASISSPNEGAHAFSEVCQSAGPAQKRQKTKETAASGLPMPSSGLAFHSPSAKRKEVISIPEETLSTAQQQGYAQSRPALFAASVRCPLLRQFGFEWTAEEWPCQAHMQAIVLRMKEIIESMKGVLKDFPEVPPPKYTAEELLGVLPTEQLQDVLATAYRYNLYKLFSPLAKIPTGLTLEAATARIRAWLASGEAKEVRELRADGRGLTCLPEEIRLLTSLTKLHLASNQLASLPDEIGSLVNLTHLSLDCNKLTSLPATVGKLMSLEVLSLPHNICTTLPAEIGNLSNLGLLYLSYNQLTSLPATIGLLQELTMLDLEGNKCTTLTAECCQLKSLRWLNLKDNQLATLPPTIGLLSELRVLELDSNLLTTLPAEMAQLKGLIILYLASNQFTRVPAVVARLVGLRQLTLDGNRLTTIPGTLKKLRRLHEISLGNNCLATVPATIAQLQGLTCLDLSNNQIASVPTWLEKLTRLERLFLDDNQLTTIPAELGKLANLKELILHGNRCTTIPPALWQLASLSEGMLPPLRDHQELIGQFRPLFGLLQPMALQNQLMVKQTRIMLKQGPEQRLQDTLRKKQNTLQQALASLQQIPASGNAPPLTAPQDMGRIVQEMLCQIQDRLQQADAATPEQGQAALQQWLDTLLVHREALQHLLVVLLQNQATREMVQLQECFKRVLGYPCLRVEAAPLAELKAITLELSELATGLGELSARLSAQPVLEPHGVQPTLDDARSTLQQTQARLGSMREQLLVKLKPHSTAMAKQLVHHRPSFTVSGELVWRNQVLALHLVQLTTAINELSGRLST